MTATDPSPNFKPTEPNPAEVKALVLAGGKGTRLRPLTYALAKQLVPVGNKPILFYALDSLFNGGIRDFYIIISPETGDAIKVATAQWQQQKEALLSGSGQAITVTHIVQDAPKGLAHAVKTAQPYLTGSDFMMYLGDNLINGDLMPLIKGFQAADHAASILLKEVTNPSAFGVAELDDQRTVVRLVEKPQNPPSNYALVGVYLFNDTIFEAIDNIQPSARGELEITDAIQQLIDSGHAVFSQIHRGWWLDTGKKDDMLAANRTVLSELKNTHAVSAIDGVDDRSQLVGEVIVGPGSRIENCMITGPVVIGHNVWLKETNVGPHTSIGDNCHIEACFIQNSVLLQGCTLKNISGCVSDSILGQECQIVYQTRHHDSETAVKQFMLADHSEIKSQ